MDRMKQQRGFGNPYGNQYGKLYDTVPDRVGMETMERGHSVSADVIDWDEVEEDLARRPSQFALCSCIYALFGMKTSSQALFDTRVQLRNLISLKQQNYNSSELRLNRAVADLRACRIKRDFPGAKLAMAAKKSAEKRMENTRRAILNFEEKLNALDDVRDSKESTEALKAIGKNMRHLNLPRRLNDAQKAYEAIDENRFDMEELQTILKPPPLYSSSNGVQITEEELESEVEAYFREAEDVEEVGSIPEIEYNKPARMGKHTKVKTTVKTTVKTKAEPRRVAAPLGAL